MPSVNQVPVVNAIGVQRRKRLFGGRMIRDAFLEEVGLEQDEIQMGGERMLWAKFWK